MKTHCTACDRFGPDCRQTFVCIACGEEKSVCGHKVGGFRSGDDICDYCHLYEKTGMVVYKTGGSSYGTRPRRVRMGRDLSTTKGEA